MKKVIVFAGEAAAISMAAPKLAPGTYQARMISAALSVDKASGDEVITACLAALSKDGTVFIEHLWQMPTPFKVKLHNYADVVYMDDAYLSPTRSQHSRHHKRKAQPNCGPQGRNQW